MTKLTTILISATLLTPQITHAASYTLKSFVDDIIAIINTVIPVLISLAIVLFFYHSGVGIFGTSSGDAASRSKLKETLIWGIAIIFVMVSIWGILNLLAGGLNLTKPR